jgi:hypothetical protein
MASYLNPKPSNSIISDLTEIRELSNYNAKADPSLGTDAPIGAKRFVKVASGQYRWEELTDTGWVAIAINSSAKLMHNVDMLDGYHASTSAKASHIPVYNANALLVGGITGNANTATTLKNSRTFEVTGIVSSTAQSFNGGQNIKIPVSKITINNDEDNAINGVLTMLHGGTGRTDGAAQDVLVDSNAGEVGAKGYGQIGQMPLMVAGTDLNSLVVDGRYITRTSDGEPYHHPRTKDSFSEITVNSCGNYITQKCVELASGLLFERYSNDKGASWKAWRSLGGNTGSDITLYVSKSGSDANTGLAPEYPVLTIDRAINIAKGLHSTGAHTNVRLCIGEGAWGDLECKVLPFYLLLCPFDGATPTAYSKSLPTFGTISTVGAHIGIAGLVVDRIVAQHMGYILIYGGFKRIGSITAAQFGRVKFTSSNVATNVWEIHPQTAQTDVVISIYNQGIVDISGYLHIRLGGNLSFSTGFLVVTDGLLNAYKGRTVFDSTTYTFTGYKCKVYNNSVLNSREANGANQFFTVDLPGTDHLIQNGVVVNGYTVGQLHLTGGELSGKLTGVSYAQKCGGSDHSKTPSANEYGSSIQFIDKNAVPIGQIIPINRTDGTKTLRFTSFKSNGADGTHFDINTGTQNNIQVNGVPVLTTTLGEVSGILTKNGGTIIANSGTAGAISILGGTAKTTGAALYLCPVTHTNSPGYFILDAINSDGTIASLKGTTSSLTWKGNEVITSNGGTFTGVITFNRASGVVTKSNNTGELVLQGGNGYSGGASLYLRGVSHEYAGMASFHVTNGTNKSADLQMWPDGTCTWAGKNIVRTVNGATANAAGAVSIFPMPNYSAAYSVVTTGNAPADGYIYLHAFGYDMTLYVNVGGWQVLNGGEIGEHDRQMWFFPVKKGQFYAIEQTGNDNLFATFIPLA